MTLEQGYFITQIVGGIVLILSIIFLALQVRQNSKMIERSMTDDHRTSWHWTYDEIARSREFAQFHMNIGANWENLDEIDRYRAEWLAMKNIHGMASSVQAKLDGYVSEKEWNFTEARISRFGNRKNMQIAWTKVRNEYSNEAQKIWDDLVAT